MDRNNSNSFLCLSVTVQITSEILRNYVYNKSFRIYLESERDILDIRISLEFLSN